MFLGCTVISDLSLFQETVPLNPHFMFSKNLMSSWQSRQSGYWVINFDVFIWNDASNVDDGGILWVAELPVGLVDTSEF